MDIEKRIRELAEEKIAEIQRPDIFVVDVKFNPVGNKAIVLLDGDRGAGIDECAQVSRYVGFKLEEENVIEEAYNLEVSTPGIDTPLMLVRQYTKNIGRTVAVKLADGAKKEGKLSAVNPGDIVIVETLKEKGKKATEIETAIPMDQISEIKVLISFK
ncbi:ribosome maturation factor RimP [Mucilaginibacter myungsuensis]|uniref:Ribosome maturation factor RimP n=1 Tax=Mucilaginibacter myungsuensis TaxID=649104 RepID=A0A929L0D5_9SPHI|nr:ribosome assembly cofactor RimP [Mucilaginibacter myungsuensis]MBE9663278.1 ribosome assembly cofactor RimP [Mucilaginibacter myungsuensis]MDN3600013.1 ribosome assembly cofactor RimP [Mucilaginibacter myungsuensis]